MIESIGAKAIEGAAASALEKSAEIAVQREMALLLQQQESMRLGEISSREILQREVISERESAAAEQLQSMLDVDSQSEDVLGNQAPSGAEATPAEGGEPHVSTDVREISKDLESAIESNRSIYEEAGVDVESPQRHSLAGDEFNYFKNNGIDGDLPCPDGRTNRERMSDGLAPYVDREGRLSKVELHHHQQQSRGPLIELDALTHRSKHSDLHPGLGRGEGRGEDPLWSQRVSEHWRQRASQV